MKAFSHIVLLSFGIVASVVAQDDTNNNNNTAPTTPNVEAVEYNDNGFPLLGYVSIPEAAQDTPVPGVVIIVRSVVFINNTFKCCVEPLCFNTHLSFPSSLPFFCCCCCCCCCCFY